jgi:hypothetical protein
MGPGLQRKAAGPAGRDGDREDSHRLAAADSARIAASERGSFGWDLGGHDETGASRVRRDPVASAAGGFSSLRPRRPGKRDGFTPLGVTKRVGAGRRSTPERTRSVPLGVCRGGRARARSNPRLGPVAKSDRSTCSGLLAGSGSHPRSRRTSEIAALSAARADSGCCPNAASAARAKTADGVILRHSSRG